MDERLVIEGGRALHGQVRISGAKNAADYAMTAALLTADDCILENVPDIEDVKHMTAILENLGAEVETLSPSRLRITASDIRSFEPPSDLVVNLRASFLVMGSLLTRFGRAACCPPGGDVLLGPPIRPPYRAVPAAPDEVRRFVGAY